MPLLFCLGQHPVLAAVSAGLRDGERLFAFHDDLYIVCRPERVGAVDDLLRRDLWQHAGMCLHAGKTNGSGTCPPASQCSVQQLQCLQPPLCGEETMNVHQQGLKVLGGGEGGRNRLWPNRLWPKLRFQLYFKDFGFWELIVWVFGN